MLKLRESDPRLLENQATKRIHEVMANANSRASKKPTETGLSPGILIQGARRQKRFQPLKQKNRSSFVAGTYLFFIPNAFENAATTALLD
jgi:hypothetical protein